LSSRPPTSSWSSALRPPSLPASPASTSMPGSRDPRSRDPRSRGSGLGLVGSVGGEATAVRHRETGSPLPDPPHVPAPRRW
jgi:hypothetical protein